MIFITNQNTVVNIPKSMYGRDLFYSSLLPIPKHILFPISQITSKKPEDMVWFCFYAKASLLVYCFTFKTI